MKENSRDRLTIKEGANITEDHEFQQQNFKMSEEMKPIMMSGLRRWEEDGILREIITF